ncbi:DUF7507 domain-containing protein [Paenibacillus dendrobii]|uniref:DUF7507 domain-containing protein n=1 Tax=Paenibacillus dendrobii TaxID=2691084 RepID=UPI00192277BF|nr:DUF11 domain-containing protein [Paenibacillus dendrobii]
MGLSRSDTAGVPGTQDSIGGFITTNTAAQYGTYPAGTTSSYNNDSSSAQLILPTGSTVLYAELIWGGSYIITGSINLSSFINNPVTFTTPAGTFSVTPDPATANSIDFGNNMTAYVRSANVTTLIQQGGGGTYTTGNVVGTIVIPNDPTGNHAGWTLGVIYQNPSLPFRNMSIRAGAVLVQATSSAVTTTLTGFATPISGALGGRALFSAQEGDANRTGDQALFGPTSATAVALSGPNNFAANFFASQINNDSGNLDTTGTFGTRNQTNGAPGTNIVGGRQGWDITNVDVSARLVNNQSSAVLILTTSGDAYCVNGNAIQVDINAPKINVVKSSSTSSAIVGDTITYTVSVNNTGTASANSVVLSDALPTGLTFVSGSVTVAGVAKPTYDIVAGAPLGTLAFASSIVVTYKATVTSMPATRTLVNTAKSAFTFQSVAGGDTITGVIPSNSVTVTVYAPSLTLTKSANKTNATVGTALTYTVLINNSGNIGAAVTFSDNIPTGSTFITGSFTVNGTSIPGANPAAGVAIGTVAAGATVPVTFSVTVNNLPSPSQLVDTAVAAYTFQPPDGRTISGSASSNTLSVPVTLPNVTVVKSSSVTDVAVGETMTYTSVVTNSGTEGISNAILTDIIPTGTTFVSGSVTVGGTALPSANPASGITVGSLLAGSSVSVAFQVSVTSLPSPSSLSNSSKVSYNSGTFVGTSLSNTVTTPVYQPVIAITKSATTSNATVGDTIQYTFLVKNTGNLAAQVTLTDNIPAGTSFVANSVTVQGTTITGASPITGISVGTVAVGATITVTFQVVLNTLPTPATLINTANSTYSYQLPSGRSLTGTSSSNTITIQASAPNVTVVKSANSSAAAVNDVVTYTLAIRNNGIGAVNNVVVSDNIPAGTTFVAGSVTLGGVVLANANPLNGVQIGNLAASANVSVTFQVLVSSLPNPAQLINQASVAFNSGTFMGTSISNTVTIPVYQAIISIIKSASTTNATVGDTLTYSFLISNTGNIPANVTLTDNIPAGSSFIDNSVLVNNVPSPGLNPITGIPVTVANGTTASVSFVVNVTSLPASRQLVDQAAAVSTFTLPGGRQVSVNSVSNTITIPVAIPNVSVVKTVSAIDAVIGDTLTFTSVVTNNGASNVNNVSLTDALPSNVSFITGSVIVNGVSRPAAVPSGISIGTLAPGAAATITFEVRITMAIPSQINNQSTVSFTSGTFSGSASSNTTTTPVTQPQISLSKSASTTNASVGDPVNYTVTISNTGNLAANVIFTDNIPSGTTFTPNSVVINGFPFPGESPATGISLGSLAPGATTVISFSVVITTLPNPQTLSNQATANYTFTPPDGRTLTGSAVSNTVTIQVSAPNVTVVKATPSTAATVGDTIVYAVTMTNAGIEAVSNVQMSDPIPAGATFVSGSVTINGTPVPTANPATGITIGSIAAGASVNVVFSILVTSVPTPATLDNTATVTFTSGVFSGLTNSNTVSTPVYQPVIAITKSANTSNATVGDTVSYTFSIINSGNYGSQVTITDNIPAGTTFVPNSVLVNGTPQAGADPTTGINAGVVSPGQPTTVIFSVTIDTLPSPQQLVNQGIGAIAFTLPDGRTINRTASSNVITISVSSPNIAVVKSTPSTALSVGDTITYTTTITNNGIAAVSNVLFTDPIPPGAALVNGSVTVNGTPRPGANPASGIIIGSIAPGSVVTVVFNALVTSLPASTTLSNQASVSFTSGAFSSVTFSNTVTTPVYQPIYTALKSANTGNATVGDTVVYTISISNTGNFGAAVTLSDTIPAGTTFQPNSVLLNGQPLPGADPSTGIPLGVVATSAVVMFSVVVNSVPPGQVLNNQASATYTFTLPDGRIINGSFTSNNVTIPVSSPNVTLVKTSTLSDASLGTVIPYSITVTNNGIANVTNVVFSDMIPSQTTFVPGSVTINGSPVPAANPSAGISLGTIAPGATTTVAFNVTVVSVPITGQLANSASASFTSGVFSGSSTSNVLVLPIYQAVIGAVKTANTTNATIGDTIVYTVTLTNTGNLPAQATVIDPIPAGAVFVPNSILVNGVPQPGADPTTGINAGSIPPGATITVSVTMQVSVQTLPPQQQLVNQATVNFTFQHPDGEILSGTSLSNVLTIPVSSPNVSVVKSTSSIDAVVGDIITYTIGVTNNGIESVNNVVLVDQVPAGSVFVAGSVTVDGVPRPAGNPNSGIQIGILAAGATTTVTFQVQVIAL